MRRFLVDDSTYSVYSIYSIYKIVAYRPMQW